MYNKWASKSRRSLVVKHILGKNETVSPILTDGSVIKTNAKKSPMGIF